LEEIHITSISKQFGWVVIPLSASEDRRGLCVTFGLFLVWWEWGATSWKSMRGTNRGNEIGPQQIVAQRLLSCLQCLTPKTKSFAEDFI
jgi:hypothetical protein